MHCSICQFCDVVQLAYLGSVLAGIIQNLQSIFFTENVPCVTFGVWHLWHLWNWTIRKKTFRGVVRKCPTWDIFPRSPFVSMKDMCRLSWNLLNGDLRAREEENGLWIVKYSSLTLIGIKARFCTSSPIFQIWFPSGKEEKAAWTRRVVHDHWVRSCEQCE